MNLRLLGIIGAVLTVLLAADGIYMLVSRYNDNETQNFHLPDGATVLIAAGIMLVITIVAFVMASRANAAGVVAMPEAVSTDAARTDVEAEGTR